MTIPLKKISRIVYAPALVVTACATFSPTPYQPAEDGRYGYRDERIGPDEYRITVAGNAATSAQVLWDYTLLRAAEIALQSEHDYFTVMPNAAGRLVTIKPAFLTPQFGIGPGAGVGVRIPLVRYEGLPVGVEPSRQLIATTVIALSDREQDGATAAFSAMEVEHRLRSKLASSVQ
jgi:hypothetical protein